MSLWIFWGWCQKCARTVSPWFRPRWRRLTCRHLPEASAVWQQATRGRPVDGHRLSSAHLSLLCTGTVRVHPSMCPADVAEEEAAAVHNLWCHLWERQQDIKMPLHPRVSLMGLPPPTGRTRLFISQQYIWQNEGKRPLDCPKPHLLGSDWMAAVNPVTLTPFFVLQANFLSFRLLLSEHKEESPLLKNVLIHLEKFCLS